MMDKGLVKKFENKFMPEPNTGCWLWMGAPDSAFGYGKFCHNRKQKSAHRWAYEIYKGVIPDGLLVCHHCDNPACVNPDHLFLGTHKVNADDRQRKGRNHNGCKPLDTHTKGQILLLRKIGLSTLLISKMFMIPISTVFMVSKQAKNKRKQVKTYLRF